MRGQYLEALLKKKELMRKKSKLILWVWLWVALLSVLSVVETAAAADRVRATLDNGLQVVVVRNQLAPVVTTMVNYLAGSNEAPEGFPGMAHAQEHMMFRGSPGLSAAQLSNLIAAMGGNFNANTQQTVTQYYFTVPAEDLALALKIEAVRMQNVLDDQKLWEEERGAIEQEVAQDYSNPMYIFYSTLLSKMFAGTPYAHDALGTRPSFQKTTGAMLKEFYDRWYGPNNAILIVVGDVDPGPTLAKVKEIFEPIPSRPAPPRPEIHLQPLKPEMIRLNTDLPYGLSVVAYRFPGYDSPDFAAGQVLGDILDSQRSNLFELVPRGKALMAGFNTTVLPQAGMGYALAAFPQGKNGQGLIKTLKEIIARYVEKGFSEELVEASKRRQVADAEFQKNSVEGLASAWSQALAVEGRFSPDDDIEAIKRVSVEDVHRVARTYLIDDTAVTAVLTPQSQGKVVSSKPFHGRESFAPKETKSVSLPDWAEKVLKPPSLPAFKVNPRVTVLPNGLRLIIQPEKISRTVSLFGRVKNKPDLETPKAQEGVSDILEDLFIYGTVTLDRLAFRKAVDDIAADLRAGSTFSLQVLSDQFDKGVQLLADNLLHPALPESAFKVVKQENIELTAGKLKSPGYLVQRSLLRSLYPKKDPTLRQATPKTLASVSLADVKRYYQKTFRPDLTTIVILGDVTPEQATEIVNKYFREWRAVGPKPRTDLPPVPPNKASRKAVPDASRVQDEVILAQTLGLTRSHPDYYALQVGNNVLSGAFYATRLYRDLREKAGLVYTVESHLEAGKTRAIFQIGYACDPPNVTKARTMIVENLKKMQTTPVTPEELRQAKTLLLRRILLSESRVSGIGERLLELALKDLPLDEPMRASRHYLAATADEVQAAFTKWIRPLGLAQVSVGPNPK